MEQSNPQSRKRDLRRAMVSRILALDPSERRDQEAELARRFDDLPGQAEAGTVLLYATAFPEELDTGPLLRRVLESGRQLACPRVDRVGKRLTLHRIRDLDADFRPGTLGIPEPSPGSPKLPPEQIDWVLVPGLAFDPRGFRLGRGAGHYDRLLPRLRPEVPRWALILEPQWVEQLPVEPHDQPIDGIVSPSRTVATGRKAL